jgi:XTP/dITP diphosphohydrolase
MSEICFATNNKHKLEEARHIIGHQFKLVSLDDINCNEELPETRDTLEGNSLQKAAYVFDRYGIPCFSDDTGLEVEALGGAPGVYSARYAGEQRSSEDNIRLLIKNLEGRQNRKARFRTVITCVGVEKEPVQFDGSVYGNIISEQRGRSGFGYDPIFIPDGYTETFAEMSAEKKNLLSHRAIALKKLAGYLKNYKP